MAGVWGGFTTKARRARRKLREVFWVSSAELRRTTTKTRERNLPQSGMRRLSVGSRSPHALRAFVVNPCRRQPRPTAPLRIPYFRDDRPPLLHRRLPPRVRRRRCGRRRRRPPDLPRPHRLLSHLRRPALRPRHARRRPCRGRNRRGRPDRAPAGRTAGRSGTGRGAVDWARRFDHMQQHTGQHLLSAVFHELFGQATISVHFGATPRPSTSTPARSSTHGLLKAERRGQRGGDREPARRGGLRGVGQRARASAKRPLGRARSASSPSGISTAAPAAAPTFGPPARSARS